MKKYFHHNEVLIFKMSLTGFDKLGAQSVILEKLL